MIAQAQQTTRKRRTKTDLASLPNRIREIRLSRGMSLSELAEMTDLTRSELHKLEKGVRRLRTDHLFPLSQALGCNAEDILSRDMVKRLAGNRGSFSFAAANNDATPAADLPVYGAEPGQESKLDFDTPQAQVARPPQLVNVPKAYALYAPTDGETQNRIPHGSLLYVNPVVPVRAGDLAVVTNGNGPVSVQEISNPQSTGGTAHKVIGVMFP